MDSHLKLSGRVALFSGLTTVPIAAAFFHLFIHFNDGLTVDWPVLWSVLRSWESLMGSVALALLFQYGLPILCASAFFFGVGARKLWTAKIGIAAAVFSSVFYLLFLRALYNLIS